MKIYKLTGGFEHNWKTDTYEFLLGTQSAEVEKETIKTYVVGQGIDDRRILKSDFGKIYHQFGSAVVFYCFEEDINKAEFEIVKYLREKTFKELEKIQQKVCSLEKFMHNNIKQDFTNEV